MADGDRLYTSSSPRNSIVEENSEGASNAHPDKVKATRSIKACLSCRSRKVRCDAVTRSPQPCTNCSLDGLKCELAPRAKPSTRSGSRFHRQNLFSSGSTPRPGLPATQQQRVLEDSTQSSISPIVLNTEGRDLSSIYVITANMQSQESIPTPQVADTNVNMWTDNLPPSIGDNTDFPVFSTNDQLSRPAIQDEDLVFPDLQNTFPDADVLEQYWNQANVLDPSLIDLLDVNYTDDASLGPTISVCDEAYVFKSPLPWVADWSIEDHRSNRKYTEIVEQRAFNLPPTLEINKLVQLYFSHAHPRLPVLSPLYFYRLINSRRDDFSNDSVEPISLALLYAIMFFACAYLRTESTDQSGIRAIRSMRCEYYSRAALLFKLGCEVDSLRQIQICLLLSTYRSYPGQFSENERWIIKAYRILQTTGVLPQKERNQEFSDRPEWKRICVCWLHRFAGAVIGLKWTSSPDLMEAFCFPWNQITLTVFEGDFGFSWLLSSTIKEQLTQIFMARTDLCVTIGHLNKILWKRTASEIVAIGETPDFAPPPPSSCVSIEEVEVRFQQWKLENASLLSMEAPSSAPLSEKRLLRAEQIHTKLSFEFAMSSLYQNTLYIERPLITDWAAALIRSSRAALWSSIAAIRDILVETLEEKLINLLPLSMLIVVFVPLTIYCLHMQTVQAYDPSAIHNLAMCSEVAKIMSELHDGSDFYARVLSNVLTLAQKYRQLSPPREPAPSERDAKPSRAPEQTDAESILPDPRLHSLVLRFNGLALALGRMPNIEAVMLMFAQPVRPSQST